MDLWIEFMDFHQDLDEHFVRAPGSEADWARFLAEMIDSPKHHVLVADEDGDLVGYVVGVLMEYLPFRQERDYGYIQEIAVAGRARGRGIARRLLDEAVAWLEAQGVPQIEVKIDHANEVSQQLHRTAGFEPQYEILIRRRPKGKTA